MVPALGGRGRGAAAGIPIYPSYRDVRNNIYVNEVTLSDR